MNLLLDLVPQSKAAEELVVELLPKVLDLFDWYERKISNKSLPCSFGFRGRTSTLLEQSNLDDYPRAVMVHDRGEVHLDIQATMIEFALTIQQHALMIQGPNSKVKQEFTQKAECYAKSMKDYLFNEQMGIYADYVGMQVEPVMSVSKKELSELVDWREDLGCGSGRRNPIGTPGKCTQPYSNDPIRNLARCCKTNMCSIDIDCNCPGCVEYTSIDDDHSN